MPPGEGTGPSIHVDFRENLVGRVPSRGEPDVFERPVCLGIGLIPPILERTFHGHGQRTPHGIAIIHGILMGLKHREFSCGTTILPVPQTHIKANLIRLEC